MLRIGLIGTENSHTDYFVRHLNVDNGREGCRVVALAGGDTEKNRTLAAMGQIDHIVESAEDLIDLVDAAVVADRHGGLHRQNAVPLLEAGKHVFVDKPTATTVADTEAIITAATKGGGVLASWSAVRLAREITEVKHAAGRLGALQVVTMTGPADPDDPHAGLFFYGPHVVEPALELLGNPEVGDIHVDTIEHTVVVTTQAAGTQLVLTFVRPDDDGRIPWHIAAAGRHGIVATDITLGLDYNARGIDHFLHAVESEQPPMPYEQLIPPVRLLEAVAEAI
ncbi:Gfo/Idh/MocA family protein [Jiangella asiatica]|uniref:Gfo/Idh/MocA family oxidoreductase n=1 Tax=Jiangella asiatica TaxID=2530372 RepID=A0A4R5CUI4_9ACTN|nr:Gfo/Idh/MocA family oxidoreductase [Jiangella asiatica]TDE03090.1 Gfo/Idh/MocA family oxidoreductase [Jiangella asiatica]